MARWGLMCTLPDGRAMRLDQISGGGRLMFRRGNSRWWGKRPVGALWTAYRADQGVTYATREEAEAVATNLAA